MHCRGIKHVFALIVFLLCCFLASGVSAFDEEKTRQLYAKTTFQISDISELSYENGPSIAITFSVPLANNVRLDEYLNVSQKNGQLVEGGWIVSKNRNTAYFTNIDPETEYTVTIYRGLESVTNKILSTNFQKDIKTSRITESIGFASTGKIITAHNSKGLPLYTTNIHAVDVDFHRVKPVKIGQFLNYWNNRQQQSNWDLNRYKPFIDLVHSARFDLNPPKNKRHLVNLPINNIDVLSQPGIYLAVMKKAGDYPGYYQATHFVVSDIGLHARFYRDEINVYVSSLQTGKALSGVSLSLLNNSNDTLAMTRTSPEGLGIFNGRRTDARYLLAQKGDQIALLNIIGPALDMSAFELGGRINKETEAFVYGPRDLYRPGETVIFNTLLRDADGNLLPGTPLKAVIRDATNREVENTVLYGDQLAYYYHEFNLSANAATGKWKLQLYIGSASVAEYTFNVEEFLPERMKLTLDDGIDKARFTVAEDVKIPVEGMYLYGAPAAYNRLSSLVEISQQRNPLQQFKDFNFGHVLDHEQPRRHELSDTKLDVNGKTSLEIGNSWSNIKSPLDVHVVTSLYESGGRPVVRDIHYTTWPSEKLIGIRPLFNTEELPGSTSARFEIIYSDRQGVLHPAENLEVKLIHERRNYYWVYDYTRGWHQNSSDNYYTAFNSNITIDNSKHALLDVPVEWGDYRIEIKEPESGTITSYQFRAGWWYGYGNNGGNQNARPDRVEIKLDKKRYQNGDTAKIAVTAPYAGEGILLVESDKPLFWQRINVPAGVTTVSVPVEEEWLRHDIYISAIVFRPSDNLAEQMPNRAIGLLHFPLDRESRKLSVSLSTPGEKFLPESKLPVKIKIENIESIDEEIKVTLALVDVGVLNITNFKTPDAHLWFFEPRRYGIDSRDLYGDIIDNRDGEIAKQRFGGDADLSRGGKKAQSDVQIVSIFHKAISVGDNGEANIELQLPDFNGRLRLMALAFSAKTFGHAESEVTIAAPVIAEISMPRFLSNNDKSTITIDIQNLSEATQTLQIDTSASSPVILENEQRTLTLNHGEKKILTYDMASQDYFGKSSIKVHINNMDQDFPIELNREWFLNIRPGYPAVTRLVRKVLDKEQSLALTDELQDLLPLTVEAELKVDVKPPVELNSHLKNLLHYPYGCLEQTTSSTYPWIFAKPQTVGLLGLNEIETGNVSLNNREEYLSIGMSRLKNLQLQNGGFGLWNNQSSEEHWLTAYVADFLTDVQSEGLAVDNTLYEKTMERLLRYVNSSNGMYGERWSDYPGHYQFAYRAYAAYVLSKVNRAPLGALRNMFDRQIEQAKSGLPLLHLGIALIKQGDRQRGMTSIERAIKQPENNNRYSYYGDYGSALRDTALMIYLLEETGIDIPGKSDLIFRLTDNIALQHYYSTQERLALFKAGVALAKQQSTAWQGELSFGNNTYPLSNYGSYQQTLTGEALSTGVSFTSKHDQKLYSQLTVAGYPSSPPAVNDQYFQVERDYYDMKGNKLISSTDDQTNPLQVETGELLLVHIKVNADRRIPDALIVDLLPAGLELENQNLKHTVKMDNLYIDGWSLETLQKNSAPKHEEYRDDRYVAAMDLWQKQIYHLFYLARAVTPGRYSVPPVYAEDMYRPFIQGTSHSMSDLHVVNKVDH